MKQARGAGGLPGADDDFAVVPVESTSESTEHFDSNLLNHSRSTLSISLTMHRG